MKRRYFIVVVAIILVATLFMLKPKDKVETTQNKGTKETHYNKDNMEPISKENALKVLKSKYGNRISNTEEDIKQVGDEYLVDVHIKIEDEKEDAHQNEEHEHSQSMGTHKINIYSGEIVEDK